MALLKTIYIPGILTVLISGNIYADDYLEMNLEDLLQVQITGSTLRDESFKTVPAAVTVFTREQIDTMGFDYLYELLNLVPGYQFNRNGDSPSGYTFSAGGRRNSSEAREVLLIVDGRVFSDPRTGGADGSLPLFPLAQIERVEIIRGPGSAIYGSNAFTGVINIISRQSQNSVSLSAGNQGQGKIDLLAGYQLGDWQLNAYGHLYTDDGFSYSLPAGQTTRDPRDASALNLDLHNGNTRMQAAYYHLDSDDFYIGETLRNQFNHYLQETTQFSVDQKLSLIESINTHISFSYLTIKQEFNLQLLPEFYLSGLSQPDSNEAFLGKGLFAGKTYRLVIANDATLDENSSLQFGAEWRRNQETDATAKNNYDLGQLARGEFPVNFYGNFEQSTSIGQLDSQEVFGIYGQWLYDLNNSTRLTLGSRFDHYQEIGKHLSPRLGIVHQFSDTQTVKLLYGEAYRAPSLSETGLTNNPVLVGNPELDYEIVKTWDLLWQGIWKNSRVAINFFHNQFEQPIATGLIGSTRTYVNGEDQSNQGTSLEINQQLNDQWLLRMHATHLFDLPDTAFREADKLASISINYTNGAWNGNISSVYHSERHYLLTTTQQASLDSYWLTYSKLGYKINRNLSVSTSIKNLTDENYKTPSQGSGLAGIPNRGREWCVELEWKF